MPTVSYDNLTDDELLAMPAAGLQARVCFYALAAANERDKDGADYLDIKTALARAGRIWQQRGEPTPLNPTRG